MFRVLGIYNFGHSTKNNPLQIGAQPCNPRLENNKENSITECKEWGLEKKVDPTGVLMEQIVIKESNKRFFSPLVVIFYH